MRFDEARYLVRLSRKKDAQSSPEHHEVEVEADDRRGAHTLAAKKLGNHKYTTIHGSTNLDDDGESKRLERYRLFRSDKTPHETKRVAAFPNGIEREKPKPAPKVSRPPQPQSSSLAHTFANNVRRKAVQSTNEEVMDEESKVLRLKRSVDLTNQKRSALMKALMRSSRGRSDDDREEMERRDSHIARLRSQIRDRNALVRRQADRMAEEIEEDFLDEAVLGGEKYKGQANPNNGKKPVKTGPTARATRPSPSRSKSAAHTFINNIRDKAAMATNESLSESRSETHSFLKDHGWREHSKDSFHKPGGPTPNLPFDKAREHFKKHGYTDISNHTYSNGEDRWQFHGEGHHYSQARHSKVTRPVNGFEQDLMKKKRVEESTVKQFAKSMSKSKDEREDLVRAIASRDPDRVKRARERMRDRSSELRRVAAKVHEGGTMKSFRDFLDEARLGGEKYKGQANPNNGKKPISDHHGEFVKHGFSHAKTEHSNFFDEPPTTHFYKSDQSNPVNARARAHRALRGLGYKVIGDYSNHGTTGKPYRSYHFETPDRRHIYHTVVHQDGTLEHQSWVSGQRNRKG